MGINVQELMKAIPNNFNPESAKGVDAVIQFLFSGDQASEWVLKVKDQTCTMEETTADDPDLTIRADAEDGVKVLTGEMDGMKAYMLGKIRVSGDLSLAMKLMNFFDMG